MPHAMSLKLRNPNPNASLSVFQAPYYCYCNDNDDDDYPEAGGDDDDDHSRDVTDENVGDDHGAIHGMRMVAIASAMKDLLAVLLSSTSAASARCRIHRCSFLSGPTPNRNPACILRALKPSGKPREFRSAGCDSALRRGPDYLRMGP